MYQAYSVIIDHDNDSVHQDQFIIKNIQNFLKLSNVHINFYILYKQKNIDTLEKNCLHLLEKIKKYTNVNIIFLYSEEEKLQIISSVNKKDNKVIYFESDCLLSLYFFKYLNNFYNTKENISFPVMHYKYSITNIQIKNKNFEMKKFLFSEEQFYQNSNLIPDWDERFYIDSMIFRKMDGKIPIVCPSPLLHNWGSYKTLIISSNSKQQSVLCDSKFSIHKFEKIC